MLKNNIDIHLFPSHFRLKLEFQFTFSRLRIFSVHLNIIFKYYFYYVIKQLDYLFLIFFLLAENTYQACQKHTQSYFRIAPEEALQRFPLFAAVLLGRRRRDSASQPIRGALTGREQQQDAQASTQNTAGSK